MLTPGSDTVTELWTRFKEEHDQQAREQLILHYAPLFKFIAGRVGANLPSTVENADLVSYGLFGLIDAIEKFEPERGLKFETYALSRIRGSIIDELRGLDWVPRSVRSRSREVERAYVELENELHRAPSDEEVAARVGMSVDSLHDLFATVSYTNVAALDELLHGGEGAATLGDSVVDRRLAAPEEAFEGQSLREAIGGAVHLLTEREQIIVALYYYEAFTLAEIGQVLGVTESRVSQLHSRAMLQLRAAMTEMIG